MTGNELIRLALKQIGVVGIGQTPNVEDVTDAQSILNMMLGTWNAQRWMVYVLNTQTIDSVNGQQIYTIGATGDFVVPVAPTMLDSVYCTMPPTGSLTPVDFPLRLLKAREDYNLLALKQLVTWPAYAYYETTYPTGNLYIYPVVQGGFKIHISYKAQLTKVANLADEMIFPDQYFDAIYWNLCTRLIPMYRLPPDPSITAHAENALQTIRSNNFQIPLAKVDSQLAAGYPGNYNIYSDGYTP